MLPFTITNSYWNRKIMHRTDLSQVINHSQLLEVNLVTNVEQIFTPDTQRYVETGGLAAPGKEPTEAHFSCHWTSSNTLHCNKHNRNFPVEQCCQLQTTETSTAHRYKQLQPFHNLRKAHIRCLSCNINSPE